MREGAGASTPNPAARLAVVAIAVLLIVPMAQAGTGLTAGGDAATPTAGTGTSGADGSDDAGFDAGLEAGPTPARETAARPGEVLRRLGLHGDGPLEAPGPGGDAAPGAPADPLLDRLGPRRALLDHGPVDRESLLRGAVAGTRPAAATPATPSALPWDPLAVFPAGSFAPVDVRSPEGPGVPDAAPGPGPGGPADPGSPFALEAAPGDGVATSHPGCVPHPPIRITENAGDEGFVLVEGTPTYRPGSGVVAGLGTEDHPYVIAGWCIDGHLWEGSPATPDQDEGILIRGTDAHVVVRNVHVDGNAGDGIRVRDAANVTLLDNEATYNGGYGVHVESSHGLRVEANTFEWNLGGLALVGSHGNDVAGNTFSTNWFSGVTMWSSHGNLLDGNTMTRNWFGAYVVRSDGTRITGNLVHDNGEGLWLSSSDHALVADNDLLENWGGGIGLINTRDTTVASNVAADNGYEGVGVFYSPDTRLVGNALADNGFGGVLLVYATDAALDDNRLDRNGLVIIGQQLAHFLHDVAPTNTVNHDPLVYVRDASDVTVPGDAGQVIVVNATDVQVEGVGIAEADVGVTAAFSHGIAVRNASITDNGLDGVFLYETDGAEVTQSNVSANGYDGVFLYHADHAVVQGTILENNDVAGVRSYFSDHVEVSGNDLAGNGLGVLVSYSTNATLSGNAMVGDGLALSGSAVDHYLHAIDAENTVNGEPVHYVREQDGVTVAEPAGQVLVAAASNVTLEGLDLGGTDISVEAAFSQDVVIRDTNMSANDVAGAFLYEVERAHVERVTVVGNRYAGIIFPFVQDGQVGNSTIADNGYDGVLLFGGDGVEVTGNTISDHFFDGVLALGTDGLRIAGNAITDHTYAGVLAYFSDGVAVDDNDVTDNGYRGVTLYASDDAHVTGNALADNGYGILLGASTNATLTGNDMVRDGILLSGYSEDHYLHRIDATNTVNGDPVRYVRQQDGTTVAGPAGQVIVAAASNVTVDGVTVAGADIGVHAAFTDHVTVRDATLVDHTVAGVLVYGAQNTHVTGTTLAGNGFAGAILYDDIDTRATQSTLADNGYMGLYAVYSDGLEMTDSVVADNDLSGLYLYVSDGAAVHRTNVEDNGYAGLVAAFAFGDPVDATDTWWGHLTGPSGGVEDACTGKDADGLGQRIVTYLAEVCFDPWRTEPVPGAGA